MANGGRGRGRRHNVAISCRQRRLRAIKLRSARERAPARGRSERLVGVENVQSGGLDSLVKFLLLRDVDSYKGLDRFNRPLSIADEVSVDAL